MHISKFVDLLSHSVKIKYLEKLRQLGFTDSDDDPFLDEESKRSSNHSQKWSISVDSWPQVEFGNMYIYLIDRPGYTYQTLKSYKSLDAYNLFVNGFVHQPYIYHNETRQYSIIKAHVERYQDMFEDPCQAWVGFNNEDGSIITGHCTCMIAEESLASVCSHIIAVLFQVISASCVCCKNKLKSSQSSQTDGEVLVINSVDESVLMEHEETLCVPIDVLNAQSGNDNKTNHVLELNPKEVSAVRQQSSHHSIETFLNKTQDVPNVDIDLNDVNSFYGCKSNSTTKVPHEEHIQEQFSEEYTKEKMEERNDISSSPERQNTSLDDMTLWEKPFKCDKCFTHFYKQDDLENHLRRHNGERPFECSACHKRFTFKPQFQRHMKTHSLDKPFKCNVCDKSFSFKDNLQRHTLIHTGVKPVKCSKCGISSCEIGEHFCKGKKFICDFCGMGFCKKSDYVSHDKKHGREKLFKCNICDKNFHNRSYLRVHVMRHTDNRPFKCEHCDRSFVTRYLLSVHMRTHTGEKPFKCKVCGKDFKERRFLQSHKIIHTGERDFMCSHCGMRFNVNYNLLRHMRKHTGEKPYKCNLCNKSFAQKTHLNLHMRVHLKGKPFRFRCDVCNLSFSSRNKLRNHNMVERHFNKCDVCDKNFEDLYYLQKHQRTHTGEKPFVCNQCGKSFGHDGNFKRHMKTHTGERPFKCEVCGKSFSQKVHLQTHVRIHTGERPFVCDDCGKSFSDPSTLVKHRKTHKSERATHDSNQKI